MIRYMFLCLAAHFVCSHDKSSFVLCLGSCSSFCLCKVFLPAAVFANYGATGSGTVLGSGWPQYGFVYTQMKIIARGHDSLR